jgi:hypothetical protein
LMSMPTRGPIFFGSSSIQHFQFCNLFESDEKIIVASYSPLNGARE